MISCRDLLKELGDYLDEDVSADLRRELEEHLAECRPCKVVADSTRQTVKIVTGCRSFELPAKFSAKIMARIRAAGSGGVDPGEEDR
jgi:anti-sigma factor (TIGR02949 family)